MWSGWPQRKAGSWGQLGVPVVEAWLAMLPVWWPGVTRRRSYQYLVQGMHQLYLGVLVLLPGEGLTSRGGGAAALVLVGGGVQQADGAQARGWIGEDGTWHLELRGDARRTRGASAHPRTAQGHPFGRLRTGLDIWVPNFWLSAQQVWERLVAVGHIASSEAVSEGCIHRVARESGFAEVRRQLRETFKFTADGPEWRDGGLTGQLFELNETLIARLEAGEGLTEQLLLEVESLKQALGAPVTPLKKPLPYAYRLQCLGGPAYLPRGSHRGRGHQSSRG